MLNSINWITGDAQLDWIEKILDLRQGLWPDYQRLGRDTMLKLYNNYPLYQWLSHSNGEVVGIINSLPVCFNQPLNDLPQEGLTWVLSHLQPSKSVNQANYLAAVSATINPKYQGLGLSKLLLTRLKTSAQEAQYKALIVPARPSKKEHYPLTDIEDYLQWRRRDNTAFDPWLRTHEQLGATISHPCKYSRYIKENVRQWEQWLNLPLPQTGHYLVKDGLNPMYIDREEDVGIYIEPNVWVIYPLTNC